MKAQRGITWIVVLGVLAIIAAHLLLGYSVASFLHAPALIAMAIIMILLFALHRRYMKH